MELLTVLLALKEDIIFDLCFLSLISLLRNCCLRMLSLFCLLYAASNHEDK